MAFHMNMMSSHNGWVIDATNTSSSSTTVRVYAVCLHNMLGASTKTVHERVELPKGDSGVAKVACPSGSIMTSGGWSTQQDVHVYTSVRFNGSEEWQVRGRNDHSSSTKSLYVYAVCLTGSGRMVDTNYEYASLPGGSTGQVETTCPAGTIMTGGGFYDESTGDLSVHISSGPWGEPPDAEWRMYAVNSCIGSRRLYGYAYCMEIP
jgi:hypothetical protein